MANSPADATRPPATLATVPVGQRVRLTEPDPATVPASRARRLAELGLRAGATVEVLARTAGGGRIVAVGAGRIALDRTMTRRLAVVGLSELTDVG